VASVDIESKACRLRDAIRSIRQADLVRLAQARTLDIPLGL
jgi:hypothetical protein